MFISNSNRSNSNYYFPLEWWTTRIASLTFVIIWLDICMVVLIKWLPNFHNRSRQVAEETEQLFILIMQCCFLFPSSRMSWSSQSRNTLTITYFWCVFSAFEYLSHTTPCCFNAMRICLFRNGKSSRSKALMVQSRGLIKGFWKQGNSQCGYLSQVTT